VLFSQFVPKRVFNLDPTKKEKLVYRADSAPMVSHRLTYNKTLKGMGVRGADWVKVAEDRIAWKKTHMEKGPNYFMGNWVTARARARQTRHARDERRQRVVAARTAAGGSGLGGDEEDGGYSDEDDDDDDVAEESVHPRHED
jgi:hypothetical protein